MPVARSTVELDLRKQPHDDAVDHAQAALHVVLDRDCAVVKRRSVGAPSKGGTWVRLTAQRLETFGERGWNGLETSLVLHGVAKPEWYQGVSWVDRGREWMWRADEIELVTASPVLPGGDLTEEPTTLGSQWWADFASSMDALARHTIGHPATRHTQYLTQDRITGQIHTVFGTTVDTTVDSWKATHGDLAWQNLTAPHFHILDWEDWGAGPAGFDAASLWAASLKVPAIAERIAETRKHELMSHSGRVAWLYMCAGILASEHEETRRAAARACAEWLLSHPPSQHS